MLLSAKLIGEIAGIDWSMSDAQLARMSGCPPISVSCGRTTAAASTWTATAELNHAFHMLAITKILHDPRSARPTTGSPSAAAAKSRESPSCAQSPTLCYYALRDATFPAVACASL